MKKISIGRPLAVLLFLFLALSGAWGQNDPQCTFMAVGDTLPTDAFIHYGGNIRMKNNSRRMKLTVGQPVVGIALGDDNNMNFGYWAGFLVAPFPPKVRATQGDLLDRIQISWAPNPLGPFANQGFKIFRDGVFLAAVDKSTRNYNDFNVIAGKPYNYEVRGINAYGEGSGGKALGFQVPNGVVTGWVRTPNDNPVPNALVTLTPMQGYSAFFGPLDGAFANADTSTAGDFLPTDGSEWALTFWVKTVSTGTQTIMNMKPTGVSAGFTIKASGGNAGIQAALGGVVLNGNFASSINGWNHVTLSHAGGQYRLYLDGILTDLKTGGAVLNSEEFTFGRRASTDPWSGYLDEVRIYHRMIDELDIPEIMEGTASSLTPKLEYYWKMDEQQGTKSFDVLHRNKLYFCGPVFSNDRPPVRTAGMTNEEGYYRIESASYGTGITFLAEPMKSFYLHRSLKFVRSEQDYATLPDFSVTPKSTLELWLNSAGPNGTQTLISKRWAGSNSFQLQLVANGIDNDIVFKLNNTAQNFGLLGLGFHHLAFTIDSMAAGTQVKAFKDGVQIGSAMLPAYTGVWSDATEPWVFGARKSGSSFVDFYGGLLDEVALYDTTLTDDKIMEHADTPRNPQEKGLRIYFALDEGSGSRLNNAGSVLLDSVGMSVGTGWTIMAANQSTSPHEFAPATRQVTLNPSITSVDQVDFTDRSTIPVSGFVRYQNTDCFAEGVEILINDESYSPPIFTDSTGKFVVDLEPGATVRLTPVFEDHLFMPAFWEVINVSTPIAGVIFNDITTRKISGKVVGGDCNLPIIQNPDQPSGTVCILKVRSLDGCFERNIQLGVLDGDDSGEYDFNNLPPIEMTVAVSEHSDPDIKEFFQVLGGQQVDLSSEDTTVNFVYYAPPQVEIQSGLDPVSPTCPTVVLEQNTNYTIGIALKEYYLGEGCPLDTGNIRIINDVAGSVVDTTLSNGLLTYKFRAAIINPSPPFLQNIQIIASSLNGNESSTVKQVLVTGLFAKANTFTTQLPEVPTLILRDPPGDGSYAYFEKNQRVCQAISFETESSSGFGVTTVVDIAPNFSYEIGNFGFEFGGDVGPNITLEWTTTKVNESTMEVCHSFNERISTSASDLIVGPPAFVPYLDGWIQGGDLFVGGGLNVNFGFSDRVTFNNNDCEAAVDEVVSVAPKDYATTFMYTDYHIRNNVIRYLQAIADDPNTDPAKAATCSTSVVLWNKILQDNLDQKAKATFIRNLSFDGGIEYEYSETSDTTSSSSNTNGSGSSFNLDFNLLGTAFGANLGVIFHKSSSNSSSNTTGNGAESGITTGYVLADDDMGDAFTIDVAMDEVYDTPVFKTVSGQSSCPWEPNTAHREGNSLEFRDGSGAVVVDVPSNEAAVFKFTLGNESETNETWTYAFTAGPESNPHGAKIYLNGAILDKPIMYAIPWEDRSLPITIYVERGPEEYNYDSLEIVFYSLCEDERANELGILPDLDTILYSAQYISVHFIQPCSEVNIEVPQQDWVVFPDPVTAGSDDVMRITVSGYDKNSADFERIRLQYRPSDGDGAWINIVPPDDPLINAIQPGAEIEKSNLGDVFTQFYWDTDGLADGPFEIRAVTVCSGDASDRPGYSKVIKGRIERQPPSLIGVPQPSDGVYHVGDEISFTFNKPVDCTKINPVEDVLLFDATTDQPIDIDITCYENKIILHPNFDNKFFENRILRAEIDSIQDKVGNYSKYEQWEFYVDRNELAWLTDSIGTTKYEDQTKTITANIHNRGGYPVPFKIINVPDWVHVVPNQGTLAPNEIRPIHFTVDSTLGYGLWSDSITMRTETGQNPFFMGGDESLPLGVRVICRPPQWDLNPNLFENSENMVLELDIQGEISTDVEDMVVAFIGDTVCGRANVQFVPQVNKYLVYLTIYGNPHHVLQPIRLEVWDASECLRYEVQEDFFLFQPDDVIGNPLNPQIIHTTSYVLRDVPLGYGWNWLSFNLQFPDPGINAALASLNNPENDLMKGQNLFSVYFDGGGWLGSLNTLGNSSMYIYRANEPDTLQMLGNVLNPATTPIPVVAGWNWIGYIPNYSLPINDALSSISAQTGDLIKSQVAFAQYINPAFGWIGNLKYMQPPNGYQIKLSAPGTLIYPLSTNLQGGSANKASLRDQGNPPVASFWTVDPTQYEHSMTLIGMLRVNGANATTETMELGAFVGSQVRGSGQAIYIPPLQSYLFFLTAYANTSGEQVRYKLFDSNSGTVQDLNEQMFFTPDLHQGSIESPVPFTLPSSGTQEAVAVQSFEVQPNPFHTETTLRFALREAQSVRITVTDVSGKPVSQLETPAREGLNTVVWKGQSDAGTALASGVYFIRLQTETGSVVKRVVLQ